MSDKQQQPETYMQAWQVTFIERVTPAI